MFWKIIFYIWIFCTVFDFGEWLFMIAQLSRTVNVPKIKITSFEVVWWFIKILVFCALPIFNFIMFIVFMFGSKQLTVRVKEGIEKEKTK